MAQRLNDKQKLDLAYFTISFLLVAVVLLLLSDMTYARLPHVSNELQLRKGQLLKLPALRRGHYELRQIGVDGDNTVLHQWIIRHDQR